MVADAEAAGSGTSPNPDGDAAADGPPVAPFGGAMAPMLCRRVACRRRLSQGFLPNSGEGSVAETQDGLVFIARRTAATNCIDPQGLPPFP